MSESPGDSTEVQHADGEAHRADGAAPRADGEVHRAASGARLDGLRAEIRAVDEQLIALVGRRRDLVLAIGEAKAELGLPVLDPSQEARVVRRAAELAREIGVDEELTRDVIWRIMASARDAQEGRTRWGPPLSEAAGPDEG